MKNKKTAAVLIALAVPIFALGAYVGAMEAMQRTTFLNAAVVDPGRLIRSGQPRAGDLAVIKSRYGLGTIFCLRGDEETAEVKNWAAEHGVKIVTIQLWADHPPADGQIGLFFDVMRGDTVDLAAYADEIDELEGVDGPAARFPLPVLIHCQGGADRTGVMTALYRLAFQGRSVDEVKTEMRRHFHLPFSHPELFPFLDKIAPVINPHYGSKKAADAVIKAAEKAPTGPGALKEPAPPASEAALPDSAAAAGAVRPGQTID